MNSIKSKLMAMIMAATMVFAMVPLGAGVAFADEEGVEPTPDAPAVEEDVDVEEDAVEAKVSSPYIYASDILDYSGLLDAKGYLNLSQDTILYIDADCTIHGIDGDNRTYDYATQQWDGPIYNLTIRGDGKHKLTIAADVSGWDAIEAYDVTIESGNVFVDMTAGFGVNVHHDINVKGGTFEMTTSNSTWFPFYADNKVNISGGTLSVTNNADNATNGAIICRSFFMTDGNVTASAEKYGRGLWTNDTTVISGGTLNLTGHYEGLYTTGSFEMTGGSVSADATIENGDAFEFGGTAPAFGENVKITDPTDGVIDTNGEYYFVTDKNGKAAQKATIKYVAPTKKANTLVLKGKTVKIKAKKLKKKAKTYAISKFLIVAKAQGPVTYAKASGNKKIKIAANGKITLKKKLKKGKYKVKVNVTAAGNDNFNKVTKTATFIVKVK